EAAGPNQLVLAGELPQLARGAYELAVIDSPAGGTSEHEPSGPMFRLGRVRSEVRLTRALPGSSPDLIGRQAELEALTGWVDQLRRAHPGGQGLVCYLEAEAGMGKTRLLDQVLAYAQADTLCLVGKCESFRAGMSYWPFLS